MKIYISLSLFLILTVAQPNFIAHGQHRDWQVYSSSDDQFTVEVPSAVRIIKTAASKNEAGLDPNQRESLASYISSYEDTAASPQDSKFRVFVIDGQANIFNSLSRDNLLTYLSVMLIGDDDEPEPTSETVIKLNGLRGKEYIWAKERIVFEYGSSNAIFKRGRIFDSGNKIYVIVFVGRNTDELRSPTAARFLNSLSLGKRKV